MTSRAVHPALGIIQTVAFVLGSMLLFVALAMLAAAGVSLAYSEFETATWLTLSATITSGVGLASRRAVPRPKTITIKQGFATVGLAWFVFSLFGALPYVFTDSMVGLSNAVFESTSGFTTTGATILVDPSILPRGLLFWRSLTQWLGGMGVIVLGVAVLPFLGTGGMQLAKAETSGPSPDRLTPRFRETAKRLWLVYLVFTLIAVGFLAAGDMGLFDSILHGMTTLATGGFGTRADSIASFSAYTQWVMTVFMFIAGVSFALHFRSWNRPTNYWRDSEFRLYVVIVLVAILLVAGGLLRDQHGMVAVRDAAFTSVSVITTTGFSTADFGVWRPALQVMVLGLMFVGGMAGSTAGSIKTFRVGVLAKAAYNDLRRLVHPRAVFAPKFGRTRLTEPVIESVQSYFLFYMMLFLGSTFLLGFIDANLEEGMDLITTISATASAMGNIGPGLGSVGPAFNYAGIPDLAKWLLSGLMIVGRLELFPVLVLFTRDLWKR